MWFWVQHEVMICLGFACDGGSLELSINNYEIICWSNDMMVLQENCFGATSLATSIDGNSE